MLGQRIQPRIVKRSRRLTLGRENRLELFFERRRDGQAFDDHVVQGGPGDWFNVIRVFSALVTNSGSFREQTLMCISGAAESSVAPLPFRCRFGKGGKPRLIVKRA